MSIEDGDLEPLQGQLRGMALTAKLDLAASGELMGWGAGSFSSRPTFLTAKLDLAASGELMGCGAGSFSSRPTFLTAKLDLAASGEFRLAIVDGLIDRPDSQKGLTG